MFNFAFEKSNNPFNTFNDMDICSTNIPTDHDLYNKSDVELQAIAASRGLIQLFQPQMSKYDLINLLSKKKKKVSSQIRKLVWNTHIGKEVGEHPCLICGEKNITQLDFQCGCDNLTNSEHLTNSKSWFASPDETSVDKILPICNTCNSNKGAKTFDEYLQSIGKTRMPVLSEKIKFVMDNCVLDPEFLKSRHQLCCSDTDLCRIIATNSILWGQFIYLCDKLQAVKTNIFNTANQKIKISLWEKLIILSV